MGINVMLDLETFGTGRKAMPISIGAVKFDADTILDRFHVGIAPKSAQACGMRMDAETILWWLEHDRRDAWGAWSMLDKVSLPDALDGFSQWYRDGATDDQPIWGNGATFDNVILRDAYSTCGFDYPCGFWLDKCYRTVKGMAPDIPLQRVGVHHSAVDDAESQARHLQAIAAKLGVAL